MKANRSLLFSSLVSVLFCAGTMILGPAASLAADSKAAKSKAAVAEEEKKETVDASSSSSPSTPPANDTPSHKQEDNGRRYHITVAPVGLLLGALAGSFEYRLDDRWVIGPRFLYWNATLFDFHFQASGAGIRAAYSFRNPALQDGPYLAGELIYASAKVTTTDASYGYLSGEGSGVGVSGLAGYHWVLPSGLSFRVGVGLGLSAVGDLRLKDSSGTTRNEDAGRRLGGGVSTEVDLGWAF